MSIGGVVVQGSAEGQKGPKGLEVVFNLLNDGTLIVPPIRVYEGMTAGDIRAVASKAKIFFASWGAVYSRVSSVADATLHPQVLKMNYRRLMPGEKILEEDYCGP